MKSGFNPALAEDVSFSTDGHFVVHNALIGRTKVWKTGTQDLVFDSLGSTAYRKDAEGDAIAMMVRLLFDPNSKTDTHESEFDGGDSAACPQGLSDNEAAAVVRDCRTKSINMRLKSLGRVTGDIFMDHDELCIVKSNGADGTNQCETNLLASFSGDFPERAEFSSVQGTLVTLSKGQLFVYRLLMATVG